ncbi:MAG: orotate phosphoribosyltransferase [Candidatus Hodarchaeales archaeon]|jgi:orotate phosphoribosyltransferase
MTQLPLASTKQLISTLEKIDVLKYGNFILKDGSKSSIYIDLRILPNFPEEFQEIINIAADCIRNSEIIGKFDGIIAPPLAGIPLGVSLALKLKKRYFLARLEPKNHGTKKLIEGNISNKRILMIDDVITSGGSKIPLINTIRSHGGKIDSLFVFINRMTNKENMKEFELQNNITLSYLLSLENLVSQDNHR